MEEARAERARVLAARETQEAGGPADPGAPLPRDPAGGHDMPEAPEPGGPGKGRGAASSRTRWWIGGGFLAGAAVGAAAIGALLYAERAEPPVAEVSGASDPAVARAPATVHSDDVFVEAPELADIAPLPPNPTPGRAANAPPAPKSAAIGTVPADDASVDAPEVADTTPLSGRAATVETEADVFAPPLTDDAGTQAISASSGVEAADDPVAASGSAPLPDPEPAPAPAEARTGPTADAEPDEEQELVSDVADLGGISGSSRAPQETAPSEPSRASGTAAASPSTDTEILGASDAESGEDEADAVAAEPAPAESPPRPFATLAPSIADVAGDDAPPEAPAGGRGILYVHAAPEVTADELAGVVERLSGAGYAVEETRRVDFRISRTNVRYFHAEDAELAAGVAEAVSGISRDFTGYEPEPDAGTIEVWLEG